MNIHTITASARILSQMVTVTKKKNSFAFKAPPIPCSLRVISQLIFTTEIPRESKRKFQKLFISTELAHHKQLFQVQLFELSEDQNLSKQEKLI